MDWLRAHTIPALFRSALLLALGFVHCSSGQQGGTALPQAGRSPAAGELAAAGGSGGAGHSLPTAAGSSGAASSSGARAVAAPPTYLGTAGSSSDCQTPLHTIGFEPVAPGRQPLFLYFVGTQFTTADASSYYDSLAAKAVTEALARRGFVALSVEYANQLEAVAANKLPCLFDASRSTALLTQACALKNVDCSLGIATWGHSQGAALAHIAANYDARVKAVWTTGYGGNDGWKLPLDRLRVVNGEGDTMNASRATLLKATGLTDALCPTDSQEPCLRADGSGWIIVRKAQCRLTSADHCWFDKRSCAENAETLEPAWVDPASSAAFALELNADWVRETWARP